MSNDLWRWADPDGQQRRVRLDELRAALAGGHIAPNTPVWRSGWIGWQSAHEVPELQTSALAAANGVVPNIPPPPLAMVAMQHAFEAKTEGSFSQPPPSVLPGADEPPPPPHYVPVAVKPNSIPPGAPPSSGKLPPDPSATGPQPVSLPTTVGLPAPPEMLALANDRAAARGASAPPLPPPRHIPGAGLPGSSVPPAAISTKDPMIEELSGSALLEDASSRNVLPDTLPRSAKLPGTLPPPTDPVVRGGSSADLGDTDVHGLPRRSPQLAALLEDLANLRAGRPPKNKVLVGVTLGFAALIVVSLLALVIGAFRGKPSEVAENEGAASAPRPTEPPPAPTIPAATIIAPPVKEEPVKDEPKAAPVANEPVLGDCTLAGEAHVVSPRGYVPSGVEAASVPGAIALGFATDAHNGVGITVDPTSIGITTTIKARAPGDARRMSPLVDRGKLTLVADVDRKGDRLIGRRVVATSPPIDVGVADGALVWAPHGQNSYAKLFDLEGEGNVDAIRAVPLVTGKGIAVAFRRGGNIYVGAAKGDAVLVPDGKLGDIPGLGLVGSPAIATSGDSVLVAWSDRSSASEPWQIRWTKLGPGGALAVPPKAFAIPDGGLGGQAMSPSLVGLGAGRFAIAWSEGTPSHQVRAQTIGADGTPSGGALALSAAGVNAGQPQLAVGPDGRGVVAFLASKGKAFEVHATPIACAAAAK